MPRIKLLYALMIAGIAMCLAQIWWPHYYLTGDGPCHLYNAKVLHDMWHGTDVAFYSRFYVINYNPNPNWLSNILLGIPMYFTNGPVAEKLFLTLYAGLVVGGFYLLIKKVSGSSSYWITVIFLFVFHHTLAKGFYNFSFSTALWFWMVWSWMRFIDKKNTLNTLVFFLFAGLSFFTQLLPFVFAVATCFGLIVSYSLTREQGLKQSSLNYFIQNTITLGILTAPFVALMIRFTENEGGTHITLHHHFYRLVELVQFKYGINAVENESFLTALCGMTLAALLITAVVFRIKDKIAVNKYDGFFYSLIFILFIYLFFPENFMQRDILISMRAQLFILILAGICIAYTLPQQIKNAGGLILFFCFAGLTMVRMNYMNKASDAAEDYNSVAAHIRPYSLVLPLDFAPEGKDRNNKTIADRNYLFTHALHYAGCEKPLILLDNYEANAGYFPLQWKYKVNPYAHLSKDNGIEGQPPGADIEAYVNVSHIPIDYIVTWCYDAKALQNKRYSELDSQMKRMYHEVYTSPSKRTVLYERNK
ncbi:hypothetical protein CJD36_013565 [Flavipsychrobacter stenotrophus]|uniref:Glycosyltransferase RgtA/B/C/D-like domain-containing protein n=1 Tax=Flavipsychrobacter stenotrophus TaxID=2077091 RepID=A0A2S7SVM7_9BACT|nr:hypothetical protein [Flavipsychrobacter stenotrophus]PQJ10992.1 hypothetical protein CJD36_013565 [Flavipsychrobacter stenotrophus]